MVNNFRKNLRILRNSKSLTLEELTAKTGVNVKTLSKYETGVTEPGIENLIAICKALDTTPDIIIGATIELKAEIIFHP